MSTSGFRFSSSSRHHSLGRALVGRPLLGLALIGAIVIASPSALAGGDAAAGKEKSATCAACHGPDGNSVAATFPRLAGQHSSYIVKALQDYQAGVRKNAIMMPLAANLSAQDMADLAAYYASQEGLFETERDNK